MSEDRSSQLGDYPLENFQYYRLRELEPWERKYHFHEYDKLVILRSGRVGYEVETESYELLPWDILLIRRHTIHKAIPHPARPCEHFILYIDEKFIRRMVPMFNMMECFDMADSRGNHKVTLSPVSQARLSRLMDAIGTSLVSDRYGEEVLRITLVLQVLIQIGQSMQENAAPEKHRNPPYEEKVRPVLRYIDENLDRNLTVDQLASMAYVSRYHFMRLFKEKTGTSVHAYVRQRRLLNAAKLIRGGVSIKQAAASSGYGDYSSFYRAFRDCFGVSPSDIK